jgi:hypothetical protein
MPAEMTPAHVVSPFSFFGLHVAHNVAFPDPLRP